MMKTAGHMTNLSEGLGPSGESRDMDQAILPGGPSQDGNTAPLIDGAGAAALDIEPAVRAPT